MTFSIWFGLGNAGSHLFFTAAIPFRVFSMSAQDCSGISNINRKWQKSYLNFSTRTVRNKSAFSFSILDVILRHPRIRVTLSLSGNAGYFSHGLEIYLKKPRSVVPSWWPSPSTVESSVPWSIIYIVVRGWGHLRFIDAAIFETKGHITTICLTKKNGSKISSLFLTSSHVIDKELTTPCGNGLPCVFSQLPRESAIYRVLWCSCVFKLLLRKRDWDTGRIRRKNMLTKFVAREMEQRESIEKRESLHEIIAWFSYY